MCGNGIRCASIYISENNLSDKKLLKFESLAGIKTTEITNSGQIRVNMGSPILESAKIPTVKSSCKVIMHDLRVDCNSFKINAVSMGNPHAVIYVDDITDSLLTICGPKIEMHPFFPEKTNVEFVKVISNHEIQVRVWERGCGETLACGTGACASVVAGIVNNLHGNKVTVHLRGGDLLVEWTGNESDPVFMTGPAKKVFSGYIEL
jgi:diaminopimelate epimerase